MSLESDIKITRIGNDMNINQKTARIVIEKDGASYTITPTPDGIKVHRDEGKNIYIRPSCANEVIIVTQNDL